MTETALARRQREYDARVQRGRELLPQATERLDYLRLFFPEAKLEFARENGHQFRQPSPDGVVPVLQMRKPEKRGRAEEAIAQMRQPVLI